MEQEPRRKVPAVRQLGALAVLGVGAGVVTWLSPGGLGEAGPVEVTGGASASVYRSVTRAAEDAPSWLGLFLEVATEGTLVILGILLVWMWGTAIRRKDTREAAGSVLTGLGTFAAYAVSEAVKLVVDEERPCRAVHAGAEAVAECPGSGDWSFPSNHATLAVGLAVGLAVLRPRLAWITLPVAGAAALLRVLVGVHYPHDVLAGATLGGAVVAAVLLACLPVAQVAASRLGRLRRNDPGLVGHHRGSGPVVDAEPGQDGTHMGLDRSLHHMEPPGDLPVGQAASDKGRAVRPGRRPARNAAAAAGTAHHKLIRLRPAATPVAAVRAVPGSSARRDTAVPATVSPLIVAMSTEVTVRTSGTARPLPKVQSAPVTQLPLWMRASGSPGGQQLREVAHRSRTVPVDRGPPDRCENFPSCLVVL